MGGDQKVGKKTLAGVIGGTAAAAVLAVLPQVEGVILRGYKDPIGIVTACAGHTKTAVLGKPYSPQECKELLDADAVEHAEGVAQCISIESLTVGQRAAVVSFAFNVGVQAFCTSTFKRKLESGDPSACAELDRWVWAGSVKLPGLVNRRKIERDMCEGVTL